MKKQLEIIDERVVLDKGFRIYGDFENPLFLAKDVAEWIDYDKDKAGQMLGNIDDDEKITSPIFYSGQVRNMWLLTEDGLYEVLMQSRKPIAKQFKKQVKAILKEIRKTGSYKAESKNNREEIMLMNAKTRMANMFLKLSDVDTLSKEYKNILVAKASQVLAGEELIPLPRTERKVYSAAEIGEILGISANMVGRLANANNLKTAEYGEWRRSKSEHSAKEVDTFMYYSESIEPLRNLIPVREVK